MRDIALFGAYTKGNDKEAYVSLVGVKVTVVLRG